jgi:hypothetical protein
MNSTLEIADSVRESLPPPRLVEAAQAAERGDETCPVCVRHVTNDQKASLVLIDDGARHHLRLAHRACRPSQIERIERSGVAMLLAETFAFDWHSLLRKTTPRAVLLWENRTNFDELAFNGLDEDWTGLEVDQWMGFEPATAGLAELAMPPIPLDPTWGYSTVAIHRKDCLEVIEGGHQWHTLPGQPESWREQADRDGEILLLNGTALRLNEYSADRLNERIAAGKVLAGVIPFAQDDGSAPPLPCHASSTGGSLSGARVYRDRLAPPGDSSLAAFPGKLATAHSLSAGRDLVGLTKRSIVGDDTYVRFPRVSTGRPAWL